MYHVNMVGVKSKKKKGGKTKRKSKRLTARQSTRNYDPGHAHKGATKRSGKWA